MEAVQGIKVDNSNNNESEFSKPLKPYEDFWNQFNEDPESFRDGTVAKSDRKSKREKLCSSSHGRPTGKAFNLTWNLLSVPNSMYDDETEHDDPGIPQHWSEEAQIQTRHRALATVWEELEISDRAPEEMDKEVMELLLFWYFYNELMTPNWGDEGFSTRDNNDNKEWVWRGWMEKLCHWESPPSITELMTLMDRVFVEARKYDDFKGLVNEEGLLKSKVLSYWLGQKRFMCLNDRSHEATTFNVEIWDKSISIVPQNHTDWRNGTRWKRVCNDLWKGLRSLKLEHIKTTPEMGTGWKDLTSLKSFSISHEYEHIDPSESESKHPSYITDLPSKLTSLKFIEANARCSHLFGALNRMTNLQDLGLYGCDISGEDPKEGIKLAESLKVVAINEAIPSSVLESLTGCPNLTILSYTPDNIGQDHVNAIGKLTQLKILNLATNTSKWQAEDLTPLDSLKLENSNSSDWPNNLSGTM